MTKASKEPNNKYYEVSLPVFKKGDDMHYCVENSATIPEAFLMQAETYEAAATICRRMASFIAETPECKFEQAGTHVITVSGPAESFAGLVADGILLEDLWDEDLEDEDWDDEELDEEDEESAIFKDEE